jgi:hypothetical protein
MRRTFVQIQGVTPSLVRADLPPFMRIWPAMPRETPDERRCREAGDARADFQDEDVVV